MTTVLIIIGLLVLLSVGLIVWLKYKDSHNESDEQPSEPVSNQESLKMEAGRWYMCIKDGVFGGYPDGDTFFKKGEVYYCDEQGIVDHNNQNFHENFDKDDFSEYFRLATEDEIPKPEQPQEPVKLKFMVDDWVVSPLGVVWHIDSYDSKYFQVSNIIGTYSYFRVKDQDLWHLWTIEDAKDGDVIYHTCHGHECYDIIKEVIGELGKKGEKVTFHISLSMPDGYVEAGCYSNITTMMIAKPATKEQRDLLFAKIEEAGYTWDDETKTLSKKEEPQEPETPSEPEFTDKPTLFDDLIDYFDKVVNIPKDGKTYSYLKSMYEKFINDGLLDEGNFPTPYNYWGEKENDCWIEQGNAKLFANILSELVPDKAELLQQMGYDYPIKGAYQSTYGWNFLTDPNVNRDVADVFYSANKDIDLISKLREELGGKMVSYKNDVSELFIDNTKWMPSAPAPYLKDYSKRKNLPASSELTAKIDEEINEYVAKYYSLDTKNAELRQATIQAISNKEYKKPHLFGKPRTVTDPKYGTMTFNPVFGVHNIGIEIDPNGKIADLCYSIGRICTDSRKPLLDQEYGRRRPGQGDTDPSANKVKERRALVNFTIEEGDGHTTGYYNQNGDYVDNNGTHIGDYETYFQGQLYANSYPSGHSAFIKGVAMTLADIMPDKADKILKAMNEFAISRCICRYHHMSDTIHGRVIGGFIVPVLCACTNIDYYNRLKEAREEYLNPKPQPTERVNVSLAYSIGGYGSCHVDAGEPQMIHCCTKQCTKERHPSITVNQKVNFTIEGGVTTDDGKTYGIWEANKAYGLKCPAVKEDKYAYITMRNENGVKVCQYRLSKDGTHDDGAGEY